MNRIPEIDWRRVDALIDLAVSEDLDDTGDVTTLAVVPADKRAKAVLRCKQEKMVVAGQDVAGRVFARIDGDIVYRALKPDGSVCADREIIAEVCGPARALLTAERIALNFLQRLCGVATAASRYAAVLSGSVTKVLDTRKTTPGFRNLEKYAVAVGGASNHRMGLYDRAMIKDNHRELAAMDGDGGVARSVARVRRMFPRMEIEVEADRLEEVREAAEAGADYILLDNMSDATMAEAVRINAGRSRLEASGGITIERLPSIGKLGLDFVSVGALTHSVKAADISMDIIPN